MSATPGYMVLVSIFLWVLLGPYLVVWCVFGLRLLTKPRSPSLPRELARAAFLASFPACAGLAMGLTVASAGIDPEIEFLMVPFPVAVTGAWELLCLLAAVWLRMRLPPEEPEPSHAELGSGTNDPAPSQPGPS